MSIRRVLAVAVLVAAAFALASALFTHDGVGALEYVALTLVLLLTAARLTRRASLD